MELFCEKISLKIFNQKLFNQTDEGNSSAGALHNSAQLLSGFLGDGIWLIRN